MDITNSFADMTAYLPAHTQQHACTQSGHKKHQIPLRTQPHSTKKTELGIVTEKSKIIVELRAYQSIAIARTTMITKYVMKGVNEKHK